jgi:hydroxyacylglutathione hydrolase
MLVHRIVVGSLETNCYILIDENTKKGIVIDPGADFSTIKRKIKELKVKVEKIVLTHWHIDHISALDELKEYTEADILMHSEDERMLLESVDDLSFFAGNKKIFSHVDKKLEDGDIIKCGKIELEVVHTPGHSAGGICLLGDGVIFTGDTLFKGSVGRTDLPGSSCNNLEKSLKKILSLKGNLTVYPGHGPVSNLEWEKENNPFLVELK